MGEVLLLLSAVWGRWINTTWITNYFDVGPRPVWLILIEVMFASLMIERQPKLAGICEGMFGRIFRRISSLLSPYAVWLTHSTQPTVR